MPAASANSAVAARIGDNVFIVASDGQMNVSTIEGSPLGALPATVKSATYVVSALSAVVLASVFFQ